MSLNTKHNFSIRKFLYKMTMNNKNYPQLLNLYLAIVLDWRRIVNETRDFFSHNELFILGEILQI